MIKIIIPSFTFLFTLLTYGQKSCDCAETLQFVSKEIENNSASFADQVIKSKRTSDYKKHRKQIVKLSKEAKTEKECFGVIQYYLSFLRDAHQKLYLTNDYYTFKSFDDSISVKKFITKNVENFPLRIIESKELLGNWYYKDGTFAIQIQNNQQKGRKYIGVLQNTVRQKNQFWGNRGDLKIEFYENYKKELYAIYWSFGQQPAAYKVEFADGVLKLGRSMVFHRNSSQIEKTTEVALNVINLRNFI